MSRRGLRWTEAGPGEWRAWVCCLRLRAAAGHGGWQGSTWSIGGSSVRRCGLIRQTLADARADAERLARDVATTWHAAGDERGVGLLRALGGMKP